MTVAMELLDKQADSVFHMCLGPNSSDFIDKSVSCTLVLSFCWSQSHGSSMLCPVFAYQDGGSDYVLSHFLMPGFLNLI